MGRRALRCAVESTTGAARMRWSRVVSRRPAARAARRVRRRRSGRLPRNGAGVTNGIPARACEPSCCIHIPLPADRRYAAALSPRLPSLGEKTTSLVGGCDVDRARVRAVDPGRGFADTDELRRCAQPSPVRRLREASGRVRRHVVGPSTSRSAPAACAPTSARLATLGAHAIGCGPVRAGRVVQPRRCETTRSRNVAAIATSAARGGCHCSCATNRQNSAAPAAATSA